MSIKFEGAEDNTVWIFVGTGQSLSVGCLAGSPVQTPETPGPIVGHYMNDNIWNDDHNGVRTPHSGWTLVWVKNPMRLEGANDQDWPFNAWYETPHAAMAQRMSQLNTSIKTGQIAAGKNGAPYSYIEKGGIGASYQGSIDEVTEMCVKLVALGKTPKIAAIILTHGESDNGDPLYWTYVEELLANYRADLMAITGQTEDFPLIMTQPSAAWPTNLGSFSSIPNQMNDHADGVNVILGGPRYQFTYNPGDIHLLPDGTAAMGYLYTEVWLRWKVAGYFYPLLPTGIETSGSSIIYVTFGEDVHFDTSVWDSNHSVDQTEWEFGRGFEVKDAGGAVGILSAELTDPNIVKLTLATSLGASPVVSYAYRIDDDLKPRRGQVRNAAGDWCCTFGDTVPTVGPPPPVYNPAVDVLERFLALGDYDAGTTTWAATASAGSSGSNPLTFTLGTAPTTGPDLNGLPTAEFAAGGLKYANDPTDIYGASAYTQYDLIYIVSCGTSDADAFYAREKVSAPVSGAALYKSISSTGGGKIQCVDYDGTFDGPEVAFPFGAWALLTTRWDDTTNKLSARINGDPWVDVTMAGPMALSAGVAMYLGYSSPVSVTSMYTAAHISAKLVHDDAKCNNYLDYFRSISGLAL